jgi:outer membrane protein OmpA-like peptidoglycan-associated protein
MNIIKQVADALKQQPALKVRVEGHTDSTGDAAKNPPLRCAISPTEMRPSCPLLNG